MTYMVAMSLRKLYFLEQLSVLAYLMTYLSLQVLFLIFFCPEQYFSEHMSHRN